MREAVNKKLIIFDFDGVLNLSSMEAYYHVNNATLREVGVNLSLERQKAVIDREWGSSHREILKALLGQNPQLLIDDPELFDRALKTYGEVLADDFPELIQPVPGAAQMLGRLACREDLVLALNSAADPEVLFNKVMPKSGIHPSLFEGGMMLALDLIDPRLAKPDPHTTNELMRRNNISPENTLMVGDADCDVLTALQAGAEPAVTLTGFLDRRTARLLGVKEDFILEDITELEPLVSRIGNVALNGAH